VYRPFNKKIRYKDSSLHVTSCPKMSPDLDYPARLTRGELVK